MTTARQLIADHVCTAGCIAATTEADRCRCVCRGATHGLLADADARTLLAARASGLNRLTDLAILTSA